MGWLYPPYFCFSCSHFFILCNFAEIQRQMDIHSSNLDGIGGDDNDVVDVILWSGGRISDRSGNEPMYSSGLNMFQKVSNSGGHVEMSEGEGGGFCDKQARGCCGSSSCGCIPFGHMNSVPCMLQQARVRLSDILLLGCFLDMLLELAEPPDPNELYLRQFSRVFRLGLLYSGSLLVLLVYSILYGLTAKESNWLGAVNSAAIIVLDWNLGTCLFGFELFKRRDTALLLLEHFAFFSSALGCIIVMSPLVARRDALQ